MESKHLLNKNKKPLHVILRFIKLCHNIYSNLNDFTYNKTVLNYYSIRSFQLSSRSTNDTNNKIRENIIGAIINNQIPKNYYKYSIRWNNMKKEIDKYILDLCKLTNTTTSTTTTTNNYTQKCTHKGGRNNNTDLLLTINDTITYTIEVKFNAKTVDKAPQFVSPMKPSQYLETSYEEYYYDNYLTVLSKEFNLSLPNKADYLHDIHGDKPNCMLEYQTKYYEGCKSSSKYTKNEDSIRFYNRAKELSKQSIQSFIENNKLNQDELTKYLLNTQANKYYMLYKSGKFYLQNVNLENYVIISHEKQAKLQRYVATTKTGIVLNILLRWKNGNGIAYPAFQIKCCK